MKYLKPAFIGEWIKLIREEGLKNFIRKKGWRFLLVIIIVYTIRDGILYIFLPYFAYKGLF